MAPKFKRHRIKLEGVGTLGNLLRQHLQSDKSSRQDIKLIERLTGISLENNDKRRQKNKN